MRRSWLSYSSTRAEAELRQYAHIHACTGAHTHKALILPASYLTLILIVTYNMTL